MNIILYRKTTNCLYTQGQLFANGVFISNTVEFSPKMLPSGKFHLHIRKYSDRTQVLNVHPLDADSKNMPAICSIALGHSWICSRRSNKIVIGRPLMPGAVYKGREDYETLIEWITEALDKGETVGFIIKDVNIREDPPISWWRTDRLHHCPPTTQSVVVASNGAVTVHYNNGTERMFK